MLFTPTTWLLLFLAVPLGFVAIYGLSWYDDSYHVQIWPLDPTSYLDAIRVDSGAIVIPLLLRTFAFALAATGLSLVVGYAMAYYLARLAPEKWRGILMGLIVVPFWVSFIVRVYAIFPFTSSESFIHTGLRGMPGIGWLQPGAWLSDGILTVFKLFTPQILIFTLMYVWLPFMILPLFASLSKLDPQLLEAASDLGASRWRAFLTVTLPLTYPAMVVGSILVFITSVGSFVEPELVGGGDLLFIGNYIQSQYGVIGGLPQAAASSLFIILVTVLLISIYRRYAELEEEGQTEVRSRILRPLWKLLTKYLRMVRPPKPERPVPSTMQDGGAAVPVSYAQVRVGGPIRKASWERALDVVAEKGGKVILGGVTYLMLIMFFFPLAIVVIFAFNSEISLYTWGGFSLRWWLGSPDRDGLFQDPVARDSIFYSFVVAGMSSLLAVLFGMLAAYALTRYRFRARGVLRTTMYLGLVIPSLILGVSLAILIRFLNYFVLGPLSMGFGFANPFQWDLGLWSVVVGHTTFTIPLATLVLVISFREFDRSLEEAAMNLGADEITTFMKVTLPNIMPGIISAILLGFTFSFDELAVTLFLKGTATPFTWTSGVNTMPVFIYGQISKKILTPLVNAASSIVLLLSLIIVALTTKVGKRGGKLFRI